MEGLLTGRNRTLLAVILTTLFASSYVSNDSMYVYPVDDAYIHLALVKNLAGG